jgi:hypothetical protein
MSKAANSAESRTIRVTVSAQSEFLLEQLAERGVYGRNAAEVAGRFVDEALQKFIETPRLKVRPQASKGTANEK